MAGVVRIRGLRGTISNSSQFPAEYIASRGQVLGSIMYVPKRSSESECRGKGSQGGKEFDHDQDD